MDTIGQICVLLEKKKEKFNDYEKYTLEMLHCGADDIENYITQRAEIATEIDELTEEIGRICDGEANGDVFFRTASSKINYDEVPPELHPVFEAGQQVRSVANRILQSEKQVLERLESLKEEARSKIRENQNLPKIKKYLSDLGDQPTDGNLTNGKA
ncbi:hypothetical protein LJC49_01495 [Ruminococcaceae bacterium OttesenSCG-928-I18]|nr:hypothetical protein [Ruminococcaceae bacterium OttesenSCG-928-I18]